MSKSNAIGAVLGALVLFSMPAVAATASSEDEVLIRLTGAREIGPLSYAVAGGDVVVLEAHAGAGDLMFIFAVGLDTWGEPDYGNLLQLYLGYPRGGDFLQFIQIPRGLDGRIFQILAITLDSKGEFHSSNQMTISVTGALVLHGPSNDPVSDPPQNDPVVPPKPPVLSDPVAILE